MPLDLPASPRAKVFRVLVATLRADPTLARALRKDGIRAWEGSPIDALPFGVEHAPSIRLTPATGPDTFSTPDSMKGALVINCEMVARGSNVDDLLNLWWAVCLALYPPDKADRNALALRLQNAGARSGLPMFTQPAFDPQPDGVYLAGQAQISIDVESRFN